MTTLLPPFAQRILDATEAVFGSGTLHQAVRHACKRYARDLENIQAGRGIQSLLIAIVGAKGQGKTWVARQFVRDEQVRGYLRSGDLLDDATTRLVWIGPIPPESLNPDTEMYYPCPSEQLASIGQPYVLLDMPGLTDADKQAAQIAAEALSLAPIKLLIIARDQLRAATNMTIAHQIDGAICIPIITSVEPDELHEATSVEATPMKGFAEDLLSLRQQLSLMAPDCTLAREVLVPDFEITGNEESAGQVFLSAILDRFSELRINEVKLSSAREQRVRSAESRLQGEVAKMIGDELPQLASAVEQLHRETEHLPERVLDSLLGSEAVLATGIRMRLRSRLVADTSLLWFPYRTLMSTLNLTQGAWDRVLLALSGSVPSLFGALTAWARNVKQSRELSGAVQDGIRQHTQRQVEERLRPLCNQFHRTVTKLRPRAEQTLDYGNTDSVMRLAGIEELQTRSQQIFESSIEQHSMRGWLVQLWAFLGVLLFWIFMAGPIVLIYREYLFASINVLSGGPALRLEEFPHPTPSLLFTSLLISLLPTAIYCMFVLTFALSASKVRRVSAQISREHQQAIEQLKANSVIRLEFEDELLRQAEFLLKLTR